MIQLGISAFFHDAAACLVKNGKVLAAAEEERFTEIKHDDSFPVNAINWVLLESGISIEEVDVVCWYEDPKVKDNRIKKTFLKNIFKTWKLWLQYNKVKKERDPQQILANLGYNGPISYTDHHLSHAAFSYFTSPYKEAAVLTVDGVGEWETVTISKAKGKKIEKLKSIDFPNSLGLLYSTVTAYLGFKPNEGEYKVMGLAPYGDPSKYYDKLQQIFEYKDKLFTIKQKYFTWEYSDQVMFNKNFANLLQLLPRLPEEPVEQEHKDLAAALQKVYEHHFLKLVALSKELTGSDNLCLGGGCAYNGVANNFAYRYFKSIHIPYAPSDAGSAIGACLAGYEGRRKDNSSPFLGPEYSNKEVEKILRERNLKFIKFNSEDILVKRVAKLIASGSIIAWFQGRMEFGARALGNRSILATPRDASMREKLNYVIKKREGFRPFAPSVMEEEQNKWFIARENVPYMNQVVKTKGFNRKEPPVYLPSATHVDYTARIHSVTKKQNPRYHKLLVELKNLTGFGVVLNTSFNLKDQTITMTPGQAIDRFINSDIDHLIINDYIVIKK
jgi:carbamoyltransferase